MGHKFEVGEVAVLRVSKREAEILALPEPHASIYRDEDGDPLVRPRLSYLVLVHGRIGYSYEHDLMKKPGHDDDSRQVTTWANCLWQPQGAKV